MEKITIKDSVILIGIGDLALPVVRKAKARGLKVIVTNRNPAAKSLKEADIPIVLDGNKIEELLGLALVNSGWGNIKDVYTGTELFLSVNILKQVLDLPFNSTKGVFACQHKGVMRKIWLESGVSVPYGETISDEKEAFNFVKNLDYPVILKPADSHSNQGIEVVNEQKELGTAFNNAYAVSVTKKVIIEEFITGRVCDVSGFLVGGRLYPLGIVDISPADSNLGKGIYAPTVLTQAEQDKAYELVKIGAQALGISSGPIKGDIIWKKDDPLLLEIAPRFHGELQSLYIMPDLFGIDMFDLYFNYLINNIIDDPKPQKSEDFMIAKPIEAETGQILSIEGYHKAVHIKGVEHILLQKQVGDRVSNSGSNYGLPGWVIIRGANPHEARQTFDKFKATFTVVTENSL